MQYLEKQYSLTDSKHDKAFEIPKRRQEEYAEIMEKAQKIFAQKLLSWYNANKRDLPWRRTYLPYHIWISEVMLQQTQMVRGVEYFLRWIERFPTVQSVAEANIEELYKYWEGLGYYSRASNIHSCAKRIMQEYGGEIPKDIILLEQLQGIGSYTARAIASIAFEENVPVVDANVLRIITRVFGIYEDIRQEETKKRVYSITEALLPKGKARLFNQAIMELGAILCTKKPLCSLCPISELCYAKEHSYTKLLPISSPKKATITYITMVIVLAHKGKIFMRKRSSGGLWANLWEFPEYISYEDTSDMPGVAKKYSTIQPEAHKVAQAFYDEYGISIALFDSFTHKKYSFTNNRVTTYAFYGELLCEGTARKLISSHNRKQETCFCTKEQIEEYALSSGQNKIREEYLQKVARK